MQLMTVPPMPYMNTYLATDNMPTQAWITSGSVNAPAFLLHRLAQDCHYANASLTSIAIPDLTNTIANLLSHFSHLSDDKLLTYVQSHFPVQPPWRFVTPSGILNLRSELSLIKEAARQVISSSCMSSSDTAWSTWATFCHTLHLDPWLSDLDDPIPILQIYAQ
jgi:hypothetical protein